MIKNMIKKSKFNFKLIYIFYIFIILLIILLVLEQYCRRQNKSFLEILNPSWFEDVTKFPYNADSFKCIKNCNDYNNKVQSGYHIMKNKTLVIAGLCININSDNKIDTLKKRIEHLGSFYKDYRCIIFENDSTDGTRELIKDICIQNNKFILMDCPEEPNCKLNTLVARDHGMFSQHRMKKMSDYRNRLLDYIKQKYNYFDCVAFMDFDIKGPISIDGVAHSFGTYNEWDTISSFGIMGPVFTFGSPYYYDCLAYKDIDDKYNFNENVFDFIPIILSMNKYQIGDKSFQVKSGFCGLAFYKMYVFNDTRNINYTPKDNNYICEHILLHNNMIENGYDKIFINPNMIVLVGTQGNSDMLPIF
jgi:hypothetical protein